MFYTDEFLVLGKLILCTHLILWFYSCKMHTNLVHAKNTSFTVMLWVWTVWLIWLVQEANLGREEVVKPSYSKDISAAWQSPGGSSLSAKVLRAQSFLPSFHHLVACACFTSCRI